MRRAFCAIAPAIAILAASAVPSFAHAHLLDAAPAAGSSGPAAANLVLHFSEAVEASFTGIVLKDASGAVVVTVPDRSDADPATITVSIAATLPDGSYEVDWHALAVDGHKTSGSYVFSVTP